MNLPKSDLKTVKYYSTLYSKKYPNRIIDRDDFFQEGILSLLMCKRSYDSKKSKWNTYLKSSLVNNLSRLGLSNNSPVSFRTNVGIAHKSIKIYKLLLSGMTDEEVQAKLKIKPFDYHNIKNLFRRSNISEKQIDEKNDLFLDIKSTITDSIYLKILEGLLSGKTIKELSGELNIEYNVLYKKTKEMFAYIESKFNVVD